MLFKKLLFVLSLFHLIESHLQINLHRTDLINEDNNLQHNCLQVSSYYAEESDPRQIISYCMSEFPSKFKIQENNYEEQKFTFEQLSKEKITSQQLYLWSASIDLIERYQLYLNEQHSKSKKVLMSTEMFSNCTFPYFGCQCQYTFPNYNPYHSSLNEIIHDYYYYNRYKPTLFTCYIHLKCNRGPFPSCLDWTEICDGKLDCIDSDYDEQHCWQLQIPQYNNDESELSFGYCLSQVFFRQDTSIFDCAYYSLTMNKRNLIDDDDHNWVEPSFKYEDVECSIKRLDIFGSHLTSSCEQEREQLLSNVLFSVKPNILSNECWTIMKCILLPRNMAQQICAQLCHNNNCKSIVQMTCPDMIIVPDSPILFGHVYLAYEKTETNYMIIMPLHPHYLCYNPQLFHLNIDNRSLIWFNDIACEPIPSDLVYPSSTKMGVEWRHYIQTTLIYLNRFVSSISNNETCQNINNYQCINSSKCIIKTRLDDRIIDCLNNDDESGTTVYMINNCSTIPNANYFKCVGTDECIRGDAVKSGSCDCTPYDDGKCDDENFDVSDARNKISFQTICDGFKHLSSKVIKEQNETDETNCEYWPLIHIYNRCDGFWNRPDGSDERNCESSPLLNCSTNHRICVSAEIFKLICLPIEKVNDGNIDCLGATDEPTLCNRNDLTNPWDAVFYCKTTNKYTCVGANRICDKEQNCDQNEDERICKTRDLFEVLPGVGICRKNYELDGSDIEKVLCRYFTNTGMKWKIHFTLDQSEQLNQKYKKQENSLSYQSNKESIQWYQTRCHRGIDLQVWLDKQKKMTTNVCLCPPNYYGNICQYQNQRISLILRFNVTSDSVSIPFTIIVSLIENTNQRIINSYEQFTYLPMKNCQRPYGVVLLYSTRPKDEEKDYFIQIDIYEKKTLDYRASFIKTLNFSFLPVHRLSYSINIPRINNDLHNCSDTQCQNGKCYKYFNDRNNRTFCRCKKGWTGQKCTITFISNCTFDSVTLGKLVNNRSLCICPINKIGPQCLINDGICENTTCMNKGECISVDEYEISMKKFVCICSREFTGDRCERNRTKLILTFNKNISLSSSILIHFIETKINAPHIRSTTLKKIPFKQDSITIYRSLPFHLAFIELENKTYYLIHMQTFSRQSIIIKKSINSSDQCLNLSQLFNKTIANSFLLRRIKYYHLPCQTNRSELKCFYDDIHICLCQQLDQQYVANCFEFNHNINLYCSGENHCENRGKCFEEYTTCPRISICQCDNCFYGSRCQFSTNAFSFSLDAIIGEYIRTNLNISKQPLIVIISLILTIIITFLGLTNGILSFMTFKEKSTRTSGCGVYLFSSSIIVLLTMIIFFLKFLILLLSQMGSITNRLFLTIQCYSIDFLLRSSLTMDQWLTAFVAIERVYIVIQGIYFDKKKFKLIAKWIIVGIVSITIITNSHDPIYRRLFDEQNSDDNDENKIWCIVQYSSTAVRTISVIINIFHFIVPFIINLICAIIIIVKNAHLQAGIQKKKQYRQILKEEIKQHKNLLIAPCVLTMLGIPRLIISFTSGCMKSSKDSWLFLLGYFISITPSLLTFILFVLPSTTYKKAFQKAIRQYQSLFNRY